MLFTSFTVIDTGHMITRTFKRLALCSLEVIGCGLLAILFSGCGGGGGGSNATPQFTIATANWTIPFSTVGFDDGYTGPFAGGLLSQNGNTISGILHITGSPCFDPVADALMVQGTVSGDPNAANALTFTTSPVRGQSLSLSATWARLVDPGLPPPPNSPPNPVGRLSGTWAISGGSCTGTGQSAPRISDFTGSWRGFSFFGGQLGGVVLSQTVPDAQGFSHLSGTFSVQNSPCFTTGTVANTSFAGDIGQMNVVMDSGQLTGSAQRTVLLDGGAFRSTITFNFVVHGGSCDGQSQTGFLLD